MTAAHSPRHREGGLYLKGFPMVDNMRVEYAYQGQGDVSLVLFLVLPFFVQGFIAKCSRLWGGQRETSPCLSRETSPCLSVKKGQVFVSQFPVRDEIHVGIAGIGNCKLKVCYAYSKS
jgi:hypothetical protein